MAKRGATTELNQDNWDSVEDKEEAGSFTTCSKKELQNRVIKKAKRSLSNSSGSSNSPGMTPFAKFTGFSGAASPFGSSAKTETSNFNSPLGSSAKTDMSNFNSPFGNLAKTKTETSNFNSPLGSSAKTDMSNFNSPFGNLAKTKADTSNFNSPFGTSAKTAASNLNSPFGNSAKAAASNLNSPFGNSAKTESSNFNSPFGNAAKTGKQEEKPNGTTSSNSEEKSSGDAKSSLTVTKPQEKQTRTLEYYKQLQSLNESVLKWMQLHLAKNPCCDFTPVFNDYKKHLDTLNVTYPVKAKETTAVPEKKPNFTSSSTADLPNHSGSSNDNSNFKKDRHEDETDYGANFKSNTTNTSTFSFGIKSMPTPTSSVSSVGCTSSSKEGNDSGSEEKKPQAPFSFGFFSQKTNQPNSDKPFSFACAPVSNPSGAENTDGNEEAEYVPPKNDFVAVTEEDAFYSKRCKLFFKKGESYAERGVGNLYLKPMDGKTQLLIRADTSLGNILLNIVLSASLPMSRTGKNNVLLVCIPNPPVDPKKADSKEAIPMLIRVKTAEEADELLEILNKHKS